MKNVIITLAPLEQKKFETFPSAEQLADEILECHAAGAAVLHLHVIDERGNQTTNTSVFKRVIDRIRSRCDMIIEGSTGGPFDMTPDQRSVALEVPGVEMASLNMGSANIGDGVYINSPKDIIFWSEKMKSHGIIPNMAFFEVGMTTRIAELEARNLIARPYCASLALGVEGALPATPENLLFLARSLPDGTTWTLIDHHSKDFCLQAVAVALRGNCRVGFEDSRYLAPDRKASSNVELVACARDLIQRLGRQVATPTEVRQIYGIT